MAAVVVPTYVVLLVAYGASPQATDVGYMPAQPVPYSHALHAGQLGMDCRYCHVTVETAPHAAVPPTQTCINCHANLRATSEKLKPVQESYASGNPIPWVRIHDLSDFAYFDHSAHVNRGIGCVSCHGRVDRMEVVYQHESLSMGWCLDCHRNPEKHLRPPSEATNMSWTPPNGRSQIEYGLELKKQMNVNPSQDCSSCHR